MPCPGLIPGVGVQGQGQLSCWDFPRLELSRKSDLERGNLILGCCPVMKQDQSSGEESVSLVSRGLPWPACSSGLGFSKVKGRTMRGRKMGQQGRGVHSPHTEPSACSTNAGFPCV